MLDYHFVKANLDAVKLAVKHKGMNVDIDEYIEIAGAWKQARADWEKINAERNKLDRELKRAASFRPDSALIESAKQLKSKERVMFERLTELAKQKKSLELQLPNLPWSGSPIGPDSASNRVIKSWGELPRFGFTPRDHITLGRQLDLIDIDRGVNTSGFRGYYLKNEAVTMQYGLLMLGLKLMRKAGYTLMVPPSLVHGFALTGSGQFPFGVTETYEATSPLDKRSVDESANRLKRNLYLAGTSEPSLLAYYEKMTIPADQLPIRLCGIGPCYRSEIGSYGKDTRGLYRVHEFIKVEQVVICQPDQAEADVHFEKMLGVSEQILRLLKLPYQLVETSTGDMGAGKRRMVDIETWMPSRNGYGETHSCSDLTDWQARRLGIRAEHHGQRLFAYTLNNTVIASPRILIAILENNQQADGSIKVPKALQPSVGCRYIKPRQK